VQVRSPGTGAHVTAVCGTGNVALVRSLGADAVIDYTQQDFATRGEPFLARPNVSTNG
jgi:NADPH:quinone reductase-like Zn-dependent oxidoreductase